MLSFDHPCIQSPSYLVGSVIHCSRSTDWSVVLEYSCTKPRCTDSKSVATCAYRKELPACTMYRKLPFLSMMDMHTYIRTYIHTYIHTNIIQMHAKQLTLRRSAITLPLKYLCDYFSTFHSQPPLELPWRWRSSYCLWGFKDYEESSTLKVS